MGQIANQMVLDLFFKWKEKLKQKRKQRKNDKQQKTDEKK